MDADIFELTKTTKIIGSKWTMLILSVLFDNTRRFGQLQKEIDGINPKTLSKRLKELEKEGFINKKIYAQVPPKVEYSITKKGQVFRKVIKAATVCGEKL